KEVERGLEHRLSDIVSQTFEKAGGVDTVAEILNLADRSTEKGIMEGLEAEDPDLVEQIRRLMFVFEDILLVNDKGIQSVLKEVDNDELALAMKTASQELKDKIFKNMSERAAQLIAEDMQYMGPVRVSDVESEQQAMAILLRARQKAERVLLDAQRAGEDLSQLAQAEGAAAGHREGFAKGMEEGRAQGHSQALAEHSEQFVAAVQTLASAMEEL